MSDQHTPYRSLRAGLALFLLLAALCGARAAATPTLTYLGRYDFRAADGPDHLLGTAVFDESFIAVASVTGLAMVARNALDGGGAADHAGKYRIRADESSNLDGAPIHLYYRPKLFDVVAQPPYLYATTRYDGLWVFRAQRFGERWRVGEIHRHMRPREFTESAHLAGGLLFLTHHRDGIEVLDAAASPAAPITIATLRDGLVDAWGINSIDGERVWIADGAGGVKLARFTDGQLSLIGGDDLASSPGAAFDVMPLGRFVVAAIAGRGIAVYRETDATLHGTHSLNGVCVDVEPMQGGLFAVACRSWLHVMRLSAAGTPTLLASAPLGRRVVGAGDLSTHLAQRVSADGLTLYVAGWDHVDAFRLLEPAPGDGAGLQLSSQRLHFGSAAGTTSVTVSNAGADALSIARVICPASIVCTLGDNQVPPGGSTSLEVRYDAALPNVSGRIDIHSNDPDEPVAGILVFADLTRFVDPGETAPLFAGPVLRRDYASDAFLASGLRLEDFAARGESVHFAVFGSWCPACAPAVASMVADIHDELPAGAAFFLVDQGEPLDLVRHVLEKIYLPVNVLMDADERVGGQLYAQPRVGLPFSRAYNVDASGTAAQVYTAYDPARVIEDLRALDQ